MGCRGGTLGDTAFADKSAGISNEQRGKCILVLRDRALQRGHLVLGREKLRLCLAHLGGGLNAMLGEQGHETQRIAPRRRGALHDREALYEAVEHKFPAREVCFRQVWYCGNRPRA